MRALRIITARNSQDRPFQSIEDLTQIGMNNPTINKFLKNNAAQIVE